MSDAPRHVAVVGAGALGGWTALHLARRGCRVTLVDAWGPGHARASSGGETRVIRRGYGPRAHYVPLVTRALELWRGMEAESGAQLLDARGVLWLVSDDGSFEKESLPAITAEGAPPEVLETDDLARDYPAIRSDDLRWAMLEPDAGALFARRGCEVVWDAVAALGGDVRIAHGVPRPIEGRRCGGVDLADGGRLDADAVVFAGGPWMPRLFPDLFADRVTVTRQEVFSFGPPPGDRAHMELPVWAEHGSPFGGEPTFWYGIPGGLSRGFKLGEDTLGPEFDPEAGERRVDRDRLERARAYLAHRFPSLEGAPLIDSKVCQYTQAPDGELVLDRHPDADDLWVLGAGSGHAYKLGPPMGEIAAGAVLGDADALAAAGRFALPATAQS
ncbi:MAG: FAD-dependent oxidoreductase [Planctomycetota bacterium]